MRGRLRVKPRTLRGLTSLKCVWGGESGPRGLRADRGEDVHQTNDNGKRYRRKEIYFLRYNDVSVVA
jgi:hypothetical protein